ncbi:MAG: 1-acyl-sn-glycerol-3-phosphate acyltransferase [Paludibacteraceae bacterium]|nr:1-acyl-sn-glycerol-3-phosphate acyltransferase [Paludibacteraceae bacterium]
MATEYNYDSIRPYRDEEVKEVIERMTNDPEVIGVLKMLFPDKKTEEVIQWLRGMRTIYDFQTQLIANLILKSLDATGSTYSLDGVEEVDHSIEHLYISNHRDIIMDAGILNTLMYRHGITTTENAIGDNLCARPWITDALKLNKSFLVRRSGTKRELFEAFQILSSYIRGSITSGRTSIWIAQREGRAKDSNDRTQESLLKMFSISSKESVKKGFMDLNIIPVSFSYQYDSCDYLKAKEFQQKRDDAEFKKSPADDVESMKVGVLGYKGDVHIQVTECINDEIDRLVNEEDDRQTVIDKVSVIIDKKIHEHYRIYPINYVAMDNLRGNTEHLGSQYTAEEKAKFEAYVSKQIEKIDLPNKDIPFLQERFWTMYGNPLINHLAAKEM